MNSNQSPSKKPATEHIPLELWREFYSLAGKVHEMAPWEWMQEADVFGVEDPEGGEIQFVSVMGALGEHFAVALYPGAWALSQFWALQVDVLEPQRATDQILAIRHFQ